MKKALFGAFISFCLLGLAAGPADAAPRFSFGWIALPANMTLAQCAAAGREALVADFYDSHDMSTYAYGYSSDGAAAVLICEPDVNRVWVIISKESANTTTSAIEDLRNRVRYRFVGSTPGATLPQS